MKKLKLSIPFFALAIGIMTSAFTTIHKPSGDDPVLVWLANEDDMGGEDYSSRIEIDPLADCETLPDNICSRQFEKDGATYTPTSNIHNNGVFQP